MTIQQMEDFHGRQQEEISCLKVEIFKLKTIVEDLVSQSRHGSVMMRQEYPNHSVGRSIVHLPDPRPQFPDPRIRRSQHEADLLMSMIATNPRRREVSSLYQSSQTGPQTEQQEQPRSLLHTKSTFFNTKRHLLHDQAIGPVASYVPSSPEKRRRILPINHHALSDIKCSSCHSSNPFGNWLRNHSKEYVQGGRVIEAYQCQRCFAKSQPKYVDLVVESDSGNCCAALKGEEEAREIICLVCTACGSNQSPSWFRNMTAFLCSKCYITKHNLRIDQAADRSIWIQRTCRNCKAWKSSSWYRSAGDPSSYDCKRCYNSAYQLRNEMEGRCCSLCSSTSSGNWIRGEIEGKYICKRCYNRRGKKGSTSSGSPSGGDQED